MLIIESWLDSDRCKIYEKGNQLNENEIENLVSKCILDELDEKSYNYNLSIQLSENIAKNIRRELAEKYKFYKIIVQTFLGQMSNENLDSYNFKLYASYHFDQRTDKCLSIIKNNGQM
ncbi:unnamed protein product [Adineta steineri]|uniref:Uncharacterized protein n=1 Tax=Adineta steineri TaxID=433720 RepID=A0A816CDG1_9BILA|nr:unnamed protein product [Adineta steineri]